MEPTLTTPAPIALADRPHALYRFFDEAGALLYVGITHHPTGRWRQHRTDKPWWSEVRTITLQPFADRRSVLAAEKAAILAEKPRWNAETRSEVAEWPSMCWDSVELGAIATLNELPRGSRLLVNHPLFATDEALLDLRQALIPCVDRDEKPMTLLVPSNCERGVGAANLFRGSDIRYPDRSISFKTWLHYKPGRRMRRVLDDHFRAKSTELGITLCEDAA